MNKKKTAKLLMALKIPSKQEWAIYGNTSPEIVYALATKLSPNGHVHLVDKSKNKLAALKIDPKTMAEVSLLHKDFTVAKLFDDLDGIVFPYSLHSVKNPLKVLAQTMLSTKPNGKIIVLDFETRRANPWIKYPIGYKRLAFLAKKLDLPEPKILSKNKSRFGRKSYLAEIIIPDLRS